MVQTSLEPSQSLPENPCKPCPVPTSEWDEEQQPHQFKICPNRYAAAAKAGLPPVSLVEIRFALAVCAGLPYDVYRPATESVVKNSVHNEERLYSQEFARSNGEVIVLSGVELIV